MPGSAYVTVVGLEVHIQLLTNTKIFAGDANRFGDAPNTNISVVSLAYPGTLPRFNTAVLEYAVRMGLACQSTIATRQFFDRKNYFYPDLPKGYQLTQDRTPVCQGGQIAVRLRDGQERVVRLHRIHMEEDAGKSIHPDGASYSIVDHNRAGVPLLELVTLPDIHSGEEAAAFVAEVRRIVQYLSICDGNLEEGSLRCDANISVMPSGSKQLGKKVEVKNMNSLRHIQRAVEYESFRQIALLQAGEEVVSETRTWNEAEGRTYAMRTKETLNDYRYFPDPDLAPIEITEEWVASILSKMPLLPAARREYFVQHYGLPAYDAGVLTDEKDMADYFEAVCALTKQYKSASNWIMGPLRSLARERGTGAAVLPPEAVAGLIHLVDSGKVSFSVASQKLLPALYERGGAPESLAAEMDLLVSGNDDALSALVAEVVKEFPLKVEEYKNGKKSIITMLMGEVMKRSKGKIDPRKANEMITTKLNQL